MRTSGRSWFRVPQHLVLGILHNWKRGGGSELRKLRSPITRDEISDNWEWVGQLGYSPGH